MSGKIKLDCGHEKDPFDFIFYRQKEDDKNNPDNYTICQLMNLLEVGNKIIICSGCLTKLNLSYKKKKKELHSKDNHPIKDGVEVKLDCGCKEFSHYFAYHCPPQKRFWCSE